MKIWKRGFLLFSAMFLWGGCQSMPVPRTQPLLEEGVVYIYARPYPQDANRLSFTLESISSLDKGGKFSLHLAEFSSSTMFRERLLASAVLPPGEYRGLEITVKSAKFRGEEGLFDLQLPEGPVTVDFPFLVRRGKGVVLALEFRLAGSLHGDVQFQPVFVASTPPIPAYGLQGLVSNRGSGTVTMFDRLSGRVTAVVPAGTAPSGMAVDPRRRLCYVALSEEDSVATVDLLSGELLERARLNMGDRPQELALTPDGSHLLTANFGSNTVSFLEIRSLAEEARVQVGEGPLSILVDGAGRRAFVLNSQGRTISVLDVTSRTVVSTLGTDAGPIRGQLSRNGDRLYVIHRWSPYLNIFDTASLSLLRRQFVGGGANAMKVDPASGRVYLAHAAASEIEVYDPLSLLPIDYFRVGGESTYVTIDGEANNLLLVMPLGRTLSMYSLFRRATVLEIDVGEDPYWVTVLGER